jgi:hypothetical protein
MQCGLHFIGLVPPDHVEEEEHVGGVLVQVRMEGGVGDGQNGEKWRRHDGAAGRQVRPELQLALAAAGGVVESGVADSLDLT